MSLFNLYSGSTGFNSTFNQNNGEYISEYKNRDWLNFNPNDNRLLWNSFGKESSIQDHEIVALIIIQDCNIGGEYFRYFMWNKDCNKVFKKIDNKLLFNKSLSCITNFEKIIDKNGRKWICIDIFNNPYIKLFEKII